ncbi:hypothetical protein SPI_06378 [Niveomyces insectorum RCEF 264]|uniref:Protein kinase-like domain protein n=1 Tax=Niveomyces insectorum RCEF 264 TaxID=1081102 RepID=A0A167S2W8_9HYPO|nr:hypothetical protein SPI_06378 [Niveomyces insectorum RCEF 264]
MEGPPPCTKKDFREPRLRKCPFDLNDLKWDEARILGAGMDGHVWRVRFQDDEKYYALKVFWVNQPPENWGYFAAQRECQNNALLQMIEAAVQDSNKAAEPIIIDCQPKDYQQARRNLMSFSDEYRERARRAKFEIKESAQPMFPEKQPDETVSNGMEIDSVPPLVRCYGWLCFSGRELLKMPPQIQPVSYGNMGPRRELDPSKEYTAILYQYVPPGHSTEQDLERALWFFNRVGFCVSSSSHSRNWHQGTLIDVSDLISPCGAGWFRTRYHKWPARSILNNQ